MEISHFEAPQVGEQLRNPIQYCEYWILCGMLKEKIRSFCSCDLWDFGISVFLSPPSPGFSHPAKPEVEVRSFDLEPVFSMEKLWPKIRNQQK